MQRPDSVSNCKHGRGFTPMQGFLLLCSGFPGLHTPMKEGEAFSKIIGKLRKLKDFQRIVQCVFGPAWISSSTRAGKPNIFKEVKYLQCPFKFFKFYAFP